MQESVTFALNEHLPLIEALAANEQVLSLLKAYHYSEKGIIDQYRIENLTMSDTQTGILQVRYVVNFFLGCSNINYDDSSKMTIKFVIIPENQTITLIGEYWPEREPDEF